MKKTMLKLNGVCFGKLLRAVWIAGVLGLTPHVLHAANLGTIMPMGDSITLGVPVAGGYRDPLYTLLTGRGDTFTFVGSQTGYATDTLTTAGQAHHEGHSGYVITNGTGRAGLDENLASWIGPGKQNPQKILLMIGSNDINLGYDMPNAPARLNDLITHIYALLPDVTLYVASIIPMSGHEADVQAFNAAIPGLVEGQRALGRDVRFVPMYEALNINTDLADGLHPNAQGYQRMAQAWDTALHLSTNLSVEVTAPKPAQVFSASAPVSVTATVANASGAYTVHVYTNSGAGAFAEAGTGGSTSPYTVDLGTLPVGAYNVYATVTDTQTSATSETNSFSVVPDALAPGQQMLNLTGWNQDLIIGATEPEPSYSVHMGGWNFYEKGLSGGTQGLPADSSGTPRTITSSRNPSIKFRFQPYVGNNALYLDGPRNATLTLVTPAKFQSLQFLMTTRTMSWYARLNFADGTTFTTDTWSDPDWIVNPGPADRCLTSYGLRKDGSTTTFYSAYLWMAQRDVILPAADQEKILESITFFTTGNAGNQLALFAVSGHVIESVFGAKNAVNVLSADGGPSDGTQFSVGWDFTVTQPIRLTALGQFDPNATPKANTVALYRRAGEKLVEASLAVDSPSEMNGQYSARYAAVDSLVLSNGHYVIFSTQNGNNFIAGGGTPEASFGPGILWNKGVALGEGSAAGPLPGTAPAQWPIENAGHWRYFGPTFKYELVIPPPVVTITHPADGQIVSAAAPITVTATVANVIGTYSVQVYTNSGTEAFAEAGTSGPATPIVIELGPLPTGAHRLFATVTNMTDVMSSPTSSVTVAVIPGQQPVSVNGWNHDLIIGKDEAAPATSTHMVGWLFYERGLAGSTQGLPADAPGTNRTFSSSYTRSVIFRFAPYTSRNAVYLSGPGSVTLTLVNPTRFHKLQFLETTRSMSWNVRLNFSDGTSFLSDTWSDPDWTANPGPADRCLTWYGLQKVPDGSFYTKYLWMAERGVTLTADDREKELSSITITTTGVGDKQLALFAVSGYALGSVSNDIHAVDVLSPGNGPWGGTRFSVGWDFTVEETITVTALGQFDPDANPKANTVALYQRGGPKLAEAAVAVDSPSEQSGSYAARYVAIDKHVVLPPGDYAIISTQNGNNFIAADGTPITSVGPAIRWNKGIALSDGSAAGPLPQTAPASWPIENTSATRYFGPTFTYRLGVIHPAGTIIFIH